MTRYLTAFLVAIFAVIDADAKDLPRTQTPAAPPFQALEAVRLGDEYVAKKFPQFPTLYCAKISYDSLGGACIRPDPTIVWRLRYFIPDNPLKEVPGSPFPDSGVCLVYVHKDKTVTHTAEPKRNPPK
jgi:hypothetical protein